MESFKISQLLSPALNQARIRYPIAENGNIKFHRLFVLDSDTGNEAHFVTVHNIIEVITNSW